MRFKSTLFVNVLIIALAMSLVLLWLGWSELQHIKKQNTKIELSSKICKSYGYKKSVNIVRDGKLIKFLCK